MNFPKKLQQKLSVRKENQAFRKLGKANNLVDFSSNDYLGFAKSETIFKGAQKFLQAKNTEINGSTGSRLLSGNYELYAEVEDFLCDFHQSEAALIFNSGYAANLGFFASVPQRGDIILYDEYSHASIRDGLQLSKATAYKFLHNNLEDLKVKILRYTQNEKKNKSTFRSLSSAQNSAIYVVTESVFSMDGDMPDLAAMAMLCKKHNVYLVVDEAHAVGVFGNRGCGVVQGLGLEKEVFARIVTFGKALGCHGAVVLGSTALKEYLVNFARSFIYTTALPPHALATIKTAYQQLVISSENEKSQQQKLQENSHFFQSEIKRLQLQDRFITSYSAIHSCIIAGNEQVKKISLQLREKGFDVKAILSPTVPKNQERLRFCLHSYNSKEEITKVLELLSTFVVR